MSGIEQQWPEFGPNPEMNIRVENGTLSLTGTNKLLNHAKFDLTSPDIRALAFKDGTFQKELSINSSNGDLTMDSFSVSTDDIVEIRFRYVSTLSTPWITRVTMERTLRLKVPAGTSTTTFDGTNNTMPVPSIDMTFGWDAGDKLKLGFKVNGDDGASEDAKVSTRLTTCPDDKKTTTLDLDTSNTQTHVSNLDQWEGPEDQEFSYWLKSSTSDTRQEDRWRVVLTDRISVPDYNTNFPTSGTLLKQRSDSGAVKLER